jgi:hypothetical protein
MGSQTPHIFTAAWQFKWHAHLESTAINIPLHMAASRENILVEFGGQP